MGKDTGCSRLHRNPVRVISVEMDSLQPHPLWGEALSWQAALQSHARDLPLRGPCSLLPPSPGWGTERNGSLPDGITAPSRCFEAGTWKENSWRLGQTGSPLGMSPLPARGRALAEKMSLPRPPHAQGQWKGSGPRCLCGHLRVVRNPVTKTSLQWTEPNPAF